LAAAAGAVASEVVAWPTASCNDNAMSAQAATNLNMVNLTFGFLPIPDNADAA
jgi:hypothetical protein